MAEAKKKAVSNTKEVKAKKKVTPSTAAEIKKLAVKKPAVSKDKKITEAKDGNTQIVNQDKNQANEGQEGLVTKVNTTPSKPVAKSGKRSVKALKKAEEKEAKEERKAHATEIKAETKPKQTHKPPRSRLERRGKKFREAAKLIEAGRDYSLAEALALAIKTSPVKFDAAVELHVRLSVDPKQADQNIRGSIVLPSGTGKTLRVAVFADAEGAAAAKKAGADIAGEEEVLTQLEKGIIKFDTLIATPSMMSKLGKYARVLGPKGLMPNPKSGTVATDVTKAVKEAKAGRVEYRVDSTGIVHLAVGKVSFGTEKLSTNTRAILDSIKSSKPSSVKDSFVKSLHLTTSMGPSIKVLTSEL